MRRSAGGTREQKAEIRRNVRLERRSIPSGEKEELDRAICGKFLSLASYRYADTLLIYAPIDGEIDVMPIARAAWEAGKRVAFPVCDPETRTMVFRCVDSEDRLAKRHFGIPEPSDSDPAIDPESPGTAVCVLPGLVFDRGGFRVGYGGGYYDRFLSLFRGTKVGLVYSKFLIDSAPRGRFDTAADALVTEKGVISVSWKTKK